MANTPGQQKVVPTYEKKGTVPIKPSVQSRPQPKSPPPQPQNSGKK